MDEKNTKEINLMDILAAIWRGIVKGVRYMFGFVGKMLQLLFRHKVLTLSLMLLGFGISQYFARSANKRYNADAMVTLHGVQAPTVMQIGKQLAASSPRFKETSIGSKLGLPDSIAKKIASVRFYEIIDYKKDSVPDVVDFHGNHSLSDTVNVKMRDHVYIRLTLLGTAAHANEVGNAVLDFVNKNSVVQTEFDARMDSYRERIKLMDVESKRIDSLARKLYFEGEKTQIRFNDNQLLVGNQYKQLFYGDLLFLQKSKDEALVKIAEAKAPLVAPAGFVVDPGPTNGRVKYGIYGLFVGFALAVVIGFIFENLKKWIKFLNEK